MTGTVWDAELGRRLPNPNLARLRDKVCEACGELMLQVGYKRRYCDLCVNSMGGAERSWRGLKWSYNITLLQYRELYERQKGVCAICKQPCTRGMLSVDHDHSCCPGRPTCGKCTRGLLCDRCNSSIGKFQDDADLMQEAVNYLRSTRANQT